MLNELNFKEALRKFSEVKDLLELLLAFPKVLVGLFVLFQTTIFNSSKRNKVLIFENNVLFRK